MSKGLFDDILYGSTYTSEGAELSYEEESYIENNITAEPESLSNYAIEGYIGMTQAIASIYVSEGIAATELLKGKDRNVVMESLSDKASDAYDTFKRWATKIWKAIKKFANKAWARLKYIKERIMAFFTSYENQLQNYTSDESNIPWIDLHIAEAANQINTAYDTEIKAKPLHSLKDNPDTAVIDWVVSGWRKVLFGHAINSTDPTHSELDYSKSPKKSWNEVKGQVLRITSMGYDKYYKDFLNWGEKDYREAMSIHKEQVSDRSDDFYDVEHDEENDKQKTKYYSDKKKAADSLRLARVSMQLRQRGIQLLQRACVFMYKQCLNAAKIALRGKSGVK